MLNIKALTIGLLIATLSGMVSAHSSHARMEPISQQEASVRADKVIDELLASDRLESSWAKADRSETNLRDTRSGKVWVLRYENPAASDPSKQELFIFIDDLGNILSAGHEDKK
jgi:hypothetical protein